MSLKKAAISGIKWTAGSTFVIQLITFLQLPIIARFLKPEDYGLMAMSGVFLGFAATFADMGVSAAIVHRQVVTRQQLSSLYWMNIAAGILLFGLSLLFTPLMVQIYHEPRLSHIIPFSALIFLISPWGSQFSTLMNKELQFNHLALVKVASCIAGSLVILIFAILHQGVYALVWGGLASSLVNTMMCCAMGWGDWRPFIHFSFNDLKGYLSFGLYQLGERLLGQLVLSSDQIILGYFLGAKELGYYMMAYNLAIVPISKINPIITNVAFPIFSKMQGDVTRLKHAYFQIVRGLGQFNFPLLLGLAAIAPIFIPLYYGNQWLPAIPILQVLCIATTVRVQENPIGSLQLALGRADMGFKRNLMNLIIFVPALTLGSKFGGALGTACALLVGNVLAFYLMLYMFFIKSLIGACFFEYSRNLSLALFLSVFMGVVVFWLSFILGGVNPFIILGCQMVCGVFIYLLSYWMLDRQGIFQFMEYIFNK